MSEQDAALEQAGAVSLRWPADPWSLPDLRSAVRVWLAPLGFPHETAEDILLAVNEAATNSIDHAYLDGATDNIDNTVELNLWIRESAAHLEIVDHGRWRPPRVGPSDRGFGLLIMRQVINAVLVHHGSSGTAVLLRHPLPTNGAVY